MSGLTWNQFKEYIDRQLVENDISGDEQIWYIDISFPDQQDSEGRDIDVSCDQYSGINIGT